MKIVVFGASGGTGRELMGQGMGQGHEVTAFVRNPASMAGITGIRLAVGDARNTAAVAAAVQGQEAVLSALGSHSLRDKTLLPEAMAGILTAMQRHAVKRLIVLGAAGAWPGASGKVSVVGKAIVGLLRLTLLRHAFAAQRAMQELIFRSETDWTIVQPPFLVNAPARGRYRVDGDSLPPRGMRIARADVAAFMLAQLGSMEWVRKSPFVTW
jgi:putative NADH-flavin reductase